MMKRWHIGLTSAVLVIVLVVAVTFWMRYDDYLNAVKHETNRWAVIEDLDGEKLSVEPTSTVV